MTAPLVSCLCVSRPERWGNLQRAILDFAAQTYPNRELVVVVDQQADFAGMVQAFADEVTGDTACQIRVLSRMAKNHLDGLQFAAIDAGGDILAVWDDDNLNHPNRLAVQVAVQVKHPAAVTVLDGGLYYFPGDQQVFVAAGNRPDLAVQMRALPTTLMAYRRHFPPLEPTARGKTTEALYLKTVRDGKKLVCVPGGFLHMVCVVAGSLRGYEFHRGVAQQLARPAAWIATNKAEVQKALDAYTWEPEEVRVEGKDAGAFEYQPQKHWPTTLYAVKVQDDPPTEPTAAVPPKGITK